MVGFERAQTFHLSKLIYDGKKKNLKTRQFFFNQFSFVMYITCYSFDKDGKWDVYSLIKVGFFGEDIIKIHQIFKTPN